jgi:lysyl-tRNA synthetase class 2
MKPEKKGPELGENEKLIFDFLKKESKMELSVLKSQVELSNKKWDKAIKGLASHGLTKVNKTDDGLFIELIE